MGGQESFQWVTDQDQEQIKSRILSLEEEWNRLDDTDFPSSPEAMKFVVQRTNKIMTEIAELKKQLI